MGLGLREWRLLCAGVALGVVASALVAPARPALAAGGAWTTYMRDNARDGNDTAEPGFGSVGPAWTSPNLGAAVFAQPLVYQGIVYVGTQADQLYALDQSTGAILYHWNLGTAPSGAYRCGNINGITGTPVIDTANNLLYLVGAVTGSPVNYRLFTVNLSSRAVTSVDAQPPGMDPTIHGERGALALNNGIVYVPYGGRFGDCGSYHGYVVAIRASDGVQLGFFETTSHSCGGGIWGPGGESIDGTGSVYAASGNGCGSYEYQESVLKLDPTARLVANWAPPDWASLDSTDTDLGSVTPTVLGATGLLFQAGKNGKGYVLDSNALGNGPSTNGGIGIPGAGECMGSPAFDGSNIYIGCNGGIFALRLNAGAKSFTVSWHHGSAQADSPIIAGGAIWVIDRAHNLTAYGPDGGVRYTVNLGASANFSTPSAAGGMVFAGAGSVVKAFQMNPAAPGGYNILTSFGGIYSFGNARYYGNLIDHGYPGPATGLAEMPGGDGYQILTSFGGLYSFGSASGHYFGNLIDHGYPGPAVGISMTPSGNGYAILNSGGGLYTFGDAHYFGNLLDHGFPGPAVGVAYTPTGAGYAILTAGGGIYTFGDARYFGNLIDHGYPGPAASIAYTRSGNGYWILTRGGGIYTFGDAQYQGNLIDHGYPGPATALSATP